MTKAGALVLLAAVLLLAGEAGARPVEQAPAAAAQRSADLAIALTAAPDPAVLGQNLTFVADVTNKGPERATGARVKLLLAEAKPKVVSTSTTHGICTGIGTTRVSCRLGTLDVNQTARVTIVVVAGKGGQLLSVATVAGSRADPDTSNQVARLTTKVTESEPPTGVAVTGDALARPFQTSTSFTVRWTGADPGSGVASFDVRYRVARFGKDFGPYVVWKSTTAERKAIYVGALGSTVCFSTRATDGLGNVSEWSTERCTAIPLAVNVFKRVGPWVSERKPGHFADRFIYSSVRGASLSLAGVQARQLGLVVSKCPGCGVIRVTWNGKALKTLNLSSAFRLKRTVIRLTEFPSLQRGVVQIQIVSLGKNVRIEGLAVSRV